MESLAEFIKDNSILANLTGFFGGLAGLFSLWLSYKQILRERPKIVARVGDKYSSELRVNDSRYMDNKHYSTSIKFVIQNAGKHQTSLIGASLELKRLTTKEDIVLGHKTIVENKKNDLSIEVASGKFQTLTLFFDFFVPALNPKMERIAKIEGELKLQFVDHEDVKLDVSAADHIYMVNG